MQPSNYHTYNEIKSQTEAWAQALEVVRASNTPRAGGYDRVIFTGCSSTYYLSLAAAALYTELTGRAAQAVSGGELLLNPQTVVGRDSISPYLLIAVSRSGTTTETLKAVEKFKNEKRGDVVVISNYNEALSQMADFNFVMDKGQEQSVAQTRSFASMYVVAAALAAKMAGRDDLLEAMGKLPEIGNSVIGNYESYARSIGENLEFDRFYFLGSGIRYGLACEVNLKMKEMTLTHSEPFHFLEFRHGPMSMVGKSTVVCGLVSTANHQHEAKALEEMKALGGTVSAVGEKEADVCFESNIPEEVRGVLYLPVLQLMSFYRSLAKGLNPDRPNNLTAVVKLDF
ncbi:MAG: SIS domain-containing protein [Anaerolineales bacterium]|jgi:glucosamine--fructose-6-phosphate aminotransferase (isomerizing)|nr:SIS domain-containing protein [Anaerolineales bacterium]GER79319.1 fructoselysine-6-P-deglycase FrlB [Candidatus Denitrolinea symbiosum]